MLETVRHILSSHSLFGKKFLVVTIVIKYFYQLLLGPIITIHMH